MTGYWVRDLLRVWHKAAREGAEIQRTLGADREGGLAQVMCLSSGIDVDREGIPGAGAHLCPDCLAIAEPTTHPAEEL